jgi:DNA-binding SARP family transcriptional activator
MHAHSMAIVELLRLVGRYPARERSWELLMLALYRSHRQAEALESFWQARRICPRSTDSILVRDCSIWRSQYLRTNRICLACG